MQKILLAAALLAAVPAAGQETAGLVTTLGTDTLAVERWTRTGDRIVAEAAVRSPRTTHRRYVADLAADGTLRRFEERIAGTDGAVLRTETFEAAEGGWTRTLAQGDSVRASRVEGPAEAIPFVDLVHWPMELATRRAVAGATVQPMLTGARVSDFPLARDGDAVTITHPFRGPSTTRVDAEGRLLSLDAAATTRKVVVTRVPDVDVAATARAWAEAERAGRGMGELSGRAGEEYTLDGARIALDYGVPMRRGRDIFPAVVPWGQLWRTGANRATHLSTDHDLVLGNSAGETLRLPAGEYTLFTIPQPDGGHLVVSRQTGQNGNAYDPAHDLGRVPMTRRDRAAPEDRFTIQVEDGELRIVWDRSEFVVPVRVGPHPAR
jgi:hypothetical protein